jgi:hypothetical protein
MVSVRKRSGSQVLILFDRPVPSYLPGEVVHFAVDITTERDLEVRSATATLSGRELFRFYEGRPSQSPAESPEEEMFPWDSRQFFAVSNRFLGETTLKQDHHHHFEVSLALPEAALPSFSGDILGVQWQVAVKLDRRMAADVNAEAVLHVLAPARKFLQQPGDFGVSDRPEEAEMTLQLPGLNARPGDTIEGSVRIVPREDFTAAVRLELVRHENVSEVAGSEDRKVVSIELSGSTDFAPGVPATFSWTVHVPPDSPPSVRTPNGSVDWTLSAVLDRRHRKDVTVSQPLTIYGIAG